MHNKTALTNRKPKYFTGDTVKFIVRDFLKENNKTRLARENTVAVIDIEENDVNDDGEDLMETFGDDGNLSHSGVPVTNMQVLVIERPFQAGKTVECQGFLVDQPEGEGMVNIFKINPVSISNCVSGKMDDSLLERAVFRLAVADIPYGVTSEVWDKAWSSSQVIRLAKWVKDFGAEWNQGSPGFTLVIFCSLE
jgi:hypothetical protein